MKIPHLARAREEYARRFPAGSLRDRFARGATWSLIGAAIAQGLSLAASVIVARLLGETGFGELGMIRSTVGMFGVFAGLGLGLTATKYVAEYRAGQPDRAGRVIGLSTLLALFTGGITATVVYFAAPLLAVKTINAPQLAPELRIGALLLFCNALMGAQNGVLAGFEAFRRIAKVNLIFGLASFPCLVGGVLLAGLPGTVWGLVLAAIAGLIAVQIAIRDECAASGVRTAYRGAFREWPIVFRFSVPAFLGSVLVSPVTWLVNAMLVWQPGGYAELGVLTAATQWRRVFTFVPSLVGAVSVPMLSSLQAARDNKAAKRVLGASVLTSAGVAAPALLALLLFAGPVMSLYGAGFASRGGVLRLTALTAALLAVQLPVGNLIAGYGRMWVGAAMNAGWAVVLVSSAWLFLGFGWGAGGVAGAFLIAYLCHTIWVTWFVWRTLKHPGP